MEGYKVDAERPEFLERVHKLWEAAGETVIAVDYHGINEAFPAVDPKPIQFRPAFLCPADSGVYVLSANLLAAALAELAQFVQLHRGVLMPVAGRNPTVECGARHVFPPDKLRLRGPCLVSAQPTLGADRATIPRDGQAVSADPYASNFPGAVSG